MPHQLARWGVGMIQKSSLLPMPDTQQFGEEARWQVVRADRHDSREWLANAALCPHLSRYHIAHAGILSSEGELNIRRENQSGSFILVSLAGAGEVLIDGCWHRTGVDQAVLLPPFMPNHVRSRKGWAWQFCWVRFLNEPPQRPVVHADSPSVCRFPHHPIRLALEGLIAESSRGEEEGRGEAGQSLWAEILHHYVLQIANPVRSDERLRRLWRRVRDDLDHPWNQGEMAEIACVSREHLRRLCKNELGRSPNQHLIFLRMRRARDLLASSTDTIEAVAHAVGYENAFTFSNTFQKWMGQRPSDMRG